MPTHRARRVDVAAGVATDGGAADYASAFAVSVPDAGARSAEQWARSVFEGAPVVLRWFLILGWKVVLRLRLGPRNSPDHVLGWRIAANTPQTATRQTTTLQAASSLVTAHKVLVVDDGRVTVTTMVRYERPLARLVWSAIAPVHHRLEPLLLTRAANR